MQSFHEVLRIAQVVFGIGLVIFVHEWGHYIAARLMKVRVVTFSLGFGPPLFSWRRGETRFQVAAFPIGGFCRMAGEDRLGDERPPLPDELASKSVGARFFVYSGGVLMNVVFALIVFPILFRVGLPQSSPVVGSTVPGSPAWAARVPAGARVLAVNGDRVLSFEHVALGVALGDQDETVLELQVPGEKAPREVRLAPKYDPSRGVSTIGLRPAVLLDEEGRPHLYVAEDSPAWEAGLRTGDRLVAVKGGLPGLPLAEQLSEALGAERGEGEPLELVYVDREGREHEVQLHPRVDPQGGRSLVGLRPPANRVGGVRPSPLTDGLDLRPGDHLVAVGDRPIRLATDLRRALLDAVPPARPLRIELLRDGVPLELRLPPLSREEALSLADDVALVQDLETTVVLPLSDSPALAAGVRDGDVVVSIDGEPVEVWEDIQRLLRRAARDERAARITLRRAGADEPVEVEVAPAPRPVQEYGLGLVPDEYVYRTDGILEAVGAGALLSWTFLEQSWLTLKGIVRGSVDADEVMGGPILIGRLSYQVAERGWVQWLFLLSMISVNLAFLNVLPIPVLDGGHLFFLIVEKLKRSPVSDRVLGYSQMIGVVLILSLMVYVTYNDLVRWLLPDR